MSSPTFTIPTHRPPTTVGEMLEEEFRKPLNVTQAEFAAKLGIDRVRYSSLVTGRRSLTVDTAQRLARVLGNSVEFWLNLQHMTDIYEATRAPIPPKILELEPLAFEAVDRRRTASSKIALRKTSTRET